MGKVGDRMVAAPLNRGSGVVTSFVKADGILEVPRGLEGYEAGSEVEVSLLRPRQELDNILVAIGSHDPLLDGVHALADLSLAEDDRAGCVGFQLQLKVALARGPLCLALRFHAPREHVLVAVLIEIHEFADALQQALAALFLLRLSELIQRLQDLLVLLRLVAQAAAQHLHQRHDFVRLRPEIAVQAFLGNLKRLHVLQRDDRRTARVGLDDRHLAEVFARADLGHLALVRLAVMGKDAHPAALNLIEAVAVVALSEDHFVFSVLFFKHAAAILSAFFSVRLPPGGSVSRPVQPPMLTNPQFT